MDFEFEIVQKLKMRLFWTIFNHCDFFQSHQAAIVEHALNVINDLLGFLDSLLPNF